MPLTQKQLTSVSTLVHSELAWYPESHAAAWLLALVRFLSCMKPVMALEIVLALKALFTSMVVTEIG